MAEVSEQTETGVVHIGEPSTEVDVQMQEAEEILLGAKKPKKQRRVKAE
jgi:hypothetical protein